MTSIITLLLISFVQDVAVNNSDIYLVDEFNEDLESDWRGRDKNFDEIYSIIEEEDNSYLSANSRITDNFIIREINVDIVEYPYLNWKWRARTLPKDGDESVKKYCDVVASLAVVLNASRIIPRSIKYSWSTTLKKDSLTNSPFAIWPSKCDIHVIESGDSNSGKWKSEKINVLDDYKIFYKKENVKSKIIRAIVIMSDSDNTKSISEADYDDIYFSKS